MHTCLAVPDNKSVSIVWRHLLARGFNNFAVQKENHIAAWSIFGNKNKQKLKSKSFQGCMTQNELSTECESP
jgi:hypothetical protein